MISVKQTLNGVISNGAVRIYPELENLNIVPSSIKQTFNHPNSYGYDEVIVEAVESENLQITPTKEKQEYIGTYGQVEINPIPEEYIIPTGSIDITENGNHDVTEYKDVNIDVQPLLQDKTITPSKDQQEIIADNDYYGLNKVSVNPIPEEYIIPTGSIDITENGNHDVTEYKDVNIDVQPLLQDKSVKPTLLDQIIKADEDYDGLNNVTIKSIVLQDKNVTPSKEIQNIVADEGYDGLFNVNVNSIPEEYVIPTGTIDITGNGETDISDYAKANVNIKYKPRFISFQACTLTDLQPEIEQVDASLIETLYNSFLNSEAIEIDLSSWNLSSLTVLYGTFRNNTALERLDLGNINASQITNTNYMCNGCSALNTLIIRSDGVLPLTNVNALSNTPIANGTGYVYVKDELVETYKSATNWSNYASQIKGISELV